MKKTLAVLLSFVLLLATVVCGCGNAEINESDNEHQTENVVSNVIESGVFGEQGDNLKWELTEDGVLTVTGKGRMITGITDKAEVPWQNKKNSVINMIVEEGVESFSLNASENYLNLKSVSFPATLVEIETRDIETQHDGPDNCMFNDCNSLTDFSVAEGNAVYKSVDGVLFGDGGSNLLVYPRKKAGTTYAVPGDVKEISPYAFYQNKNLTEVDLGSVENIEDAAFELCENLSTINIPDSVQNIGPSAFNSCSSAKEITIGGTVQEIGKMAFRKTGAETVRIKNGVPYISESCFEYSLNLKYIYIPKSVTVIYANAFEECESLSDVYYGGSEADGENIVLPYNANIHYNYSSEEE